ncbi:DUF1294 domain-containing protein [Ramlibacter henchirensis]|uniref:DUF1294 domain-containing protein n=1 Tax=Ramlibacter henchirensis TaxID=204072 RepID=UPI001F0CFA47|nr:cold shock and DUF1294 domain-containing protein [Ramlibacter henchirensis]
MRWDDARGFGFIRGTQGGQDIFFHVRDFRTASGHAPRIGLDVAFEQIQVGGKGPRAVAVQPAGASVQAATKPAPSAKAHRANPRSSSAGPSSGAWLVLPLMAAYAAVLGWGVWHQKLAWWIFAASPLINLLAFFAYWQDKHAAEKGRWRTSEKLLHLWSLAGGWGGAWLAQQVLRHKSRKTSFLQVYGFTVVAHCAALGAWLQWVR